MLLSDCLPNPELRVHRCCLEQQPWSYQDVDTDEPTSGQEPGGVRLQSLEPCPPRDLTLPRGSD